MIRLGIAWRLGLVMALLGVTAAGLTGYYGYTESRALLVAAAEDRLLTATRVLTRQLAAGLENTARDVRLLANHPLAEPLLSRAEVSHHAPLEDSAALLFERLLLTHPEYFQIRLIDAQEYGIERVRVDRTDDGVMRVTGDQLQEKAHFPYVFETMKLQRGAVYVSSATINHEVGAHAGEDHPTVQVAAPVHGTDGHGPLGVVVINVDLHSLFGQLSADLTQDLQLYMTNGAGDFLIHPDARMAFAFDRGERARVQDSFPGTQAMLGDGDRRTNQVVITATPPGTQAKVAAFVRSPLTQLHDEDEFILGLAQPLASVLQDSDQLGRISLRIVLGSSALAILLAMLLARAMTRPLGQIVHTVERFATGMETGPLPVGRTDEIGTLARSVDTMQQQIHAQIDSLQEQQRALDRLASHDILTGLPNRRSFMERLDQSLARARRHSLRPALLFIDLDGFKTINDTWGHAAGDLVLRTMGDRLRELVREADAVARLGGDEFIILIENAESMESITEMARRTLAFLAEPIPYEEQLLSCGCSIGIGCYPRDGIEPDSLIAAADQAMYRAKAAGRHQMRFASAPSDEIASSAPPGEDTE